MKRIIPDPHLASPEALQIDFIDNNSELGLTRLLDMDADELSSTSAQGQDDLKVGKDFVVALQEGLTKANRDDISSVEGIPYFAGPLGMTNAEYKGKPLIADSKRWLEAIENNTGENRFTDLGRMQVAIKFSLGEYNRRCGDIRNKVKTWGEFKDEVISLYPSYRNRNQIMREFIYRRRKPGEHISALGSELERYVEELAYDPQTSAQTVLDDISKTVFREAMPSRFRTKYEDDLSIGKRELVRKAERFANDNPVFNLSIPQINKETSSLKSVLTIPGQIAKKDRYAKGSKGSGRKGEIAMQAKESGAPKGRVCDFCHVPGHSVDQCRRVPPCRHCKSEEHGSIECKKCFRCFSLDHKIRDCPAKKFSKNS